MRSLVRRAPFLTAARLPASAPPAARPRAPRRTSPCPASTADPCAARLRGAAGCWRSCSRPTPARPRSNTKRASRRSRPTIAAAVSAWWRSIPTARRRAAARRPGDSDVGDSLEDMKVRAAPPPPDLPVPVRWRARRLSPGSSESSPRRRSSCSIRRAGSSIAAGIDDTSDGVAGQARDARQAIDALLAGQPVPVARTTAVGCPVKGLSGAANPDPQLAAFEQAPVSVETDRRGRSGRLRKNGTGKLLLINFWATWCAPCASEFPDLEATYRMFKPRNLEFVSVSVEQSGRTGRGARVPAGSPRLAPQPPVRDARTSTACRRRSTPRCRRRSLSRSCSRPTATWSIRSSASWTSPKLRRAILANLPGRRAASRSTQLLGGRPLGRELEASAFNNEDEVLEPCRTASRPHSSALRRRSASPSRPADRRGLTLLALTAGIVRAAPTVRRRRRPGTRHPGQRRPSGAADRIAAAGVQRCRASTARCTSPASTGGTKVLAIVFESNHCPVSQLYEGRIEKLYADYRNQGVTLVAINPNNPKTVRLDELGYTDVTDSLPEMKLRARLRGIDWPYLYDGDTQATSTKFGAVATPHIFIFDHDRKLRYQGRIDDNQREDLVKSQRRAQRARRAAGRPAGARRRDDARSAARRSGSRRRRASSRSGRGSSPSR